MVKNREYYEKLFKKDSNIGSGGCLFILLMFLCCILLRIYVIMCLWAWFVVPFGMPEISPLHVAGLVLFFSFCGFFNGSTAGGSSTDDIYGYLFGLWICWPLIALTIGYIIHYFM